MHGIQPVEINRQAPFEPGTVERRGGMLLEFVDGHVYSSM